MTRIEILARIRDNLAIILEQPDLVISEATASQDVTNWDSINHVRLLLALEGDLDVHFDPSEITGVKSAGELVSLILKKCRR